MTIQIKGVIWDFGGVIMRTEDYTNRDQVAKQLGFTRQELETLVFSGESGQQAQLGHISAAQHWDNVQQTLGLSAEAFHQFQIKFWGGDRLDYSLVSYIRNLRPNHKTGLLSNHFSSLRQSLGQEWAIDDAFDAIVISAETGMLKPDSKMYLLILDELQLNPEQAVFIDDFPHNLVGAQNLGMKTILFRSASQVQDDIKQLLTRGGQV